MSDEKTPTDWPPKQAAPTLAERIVAEALSMLDEREDAGNGKANDGEIVRKLCAPLIGDPAEFERLYDAGALEWCVAFALWCLARAGSTVVKFDEKGQIRGPLRTLSCTTLFKQAGALFLAASGDVTTFGPSRADEAQPGDLLLTDSDRNGKPGHVVIVESVFGDEIETIGGNSGPKADRVFRKTYKASDPRLFGFIRVLA
jgi:hypothetical protein